MAHEKRKLPHLMKRASRSFLLLVFSPFGVKINIVDVMRKRYVKKICVSLGAGARILLAR